MRLRTLLRPTQVLLMSSPPPTPAAAPKPQTTADPSHPAPPPPRAAQFQKGSLSLTSLSADPLTQFNEWYTTAQTSNVPVPETCTLSTASLPSGRVSARMVYLKSVTTTPPTPCFIFYSNFSTSLKAHDLSTNAHAALTFWWRELERQVRIEGVFSRLTPEESQPYFDTRIRGSKIGAWASRQSLVLEGGGREVLDRWVKEAEERFEGTEEIPVPEFWGGGRIVPDLVEFWQGRESRLHDRFRYTRTERGEGGEEGKEEGWRIERLSP